METKSDVIQAPLPRPLGMARYEASETEMGKSAERSDRRGPGGRDAPQCAIYCNPRPPEQGAIRISGLAIPPDLRMVRKSRYLSSHGFPRAPIA